MTATPPTTDMSYAEHTSFPCPKCGQLIPTEIWLIIDFASRSDLVARIQSDALHVVTCPTCGPVGMVDAALLLYFADYNRVTGQPPIIFSPAQQTTPKANQAEANRLLEILLRQLTNGLQRRGQTQVSIVERRRLHTVLGAIEVGALRKIGDQVKAGGESTDDLEEPNDLSTIVSRFVAAETWKESQRIVERHPELLSDAADEHFALALQENAGNSDALTRLITVHSLLRRCREVGVAIAFGEMVQATELVAWAEALGRGQSTQTGTSVPTKRIYLEVRQLLFQVNGLSSTADMPRRVEVCQQALAMLDRNAHEELWAYFQVELANSLMHILTGNRAEAIELAIECYYQALQIFTFQKARSLWADINLYLGRTYRTRLKGNRAENIEKAIECYERNLSVRSYQTEPIKWAETMMSLGNAYRNRIRKDRAENVEKAIQCYEDALRVWAREELRAEWARTMMNLATAYESRVLGQEQKNLEKAINCYEQALGVRTREEMPDEWALTMMNLGSAYAKRTLGGKAGNIEKAIKCFNEALTIRTRHEKPFEWAQTMVNLASAYMARVRGNRARNIDHCIKFYLQALEVRTRDVSPIEWARTMLNLASAYSQRVRGSEAKNVQQAVECYRLAAEVLSRDVMPHDFLVAQRALVTLLFANRQFESVIEPAQAVLAVAEDLYEMAPTPQARRTILREIRDVPQQLAYALCQEKGAHAVYSALDVLERNRSRWLREMLSLNDSRPISVPEPLWLEYVECLQQLRDVGAELQISIDESDSRSYLQLSEVLSDARARLRARANDINSLSPGFIPVSPTGKECLPVAPGVAVVYLLTTSVGGLALIAQNPDCDSKEGERETVTVTRLDKLTDATLTAALVGTDLRAPSGYLGAYMNWRFMPNGNATIHTSWHQAIDNVTAWLWQSVMVSVVDQLAQYNVTEAVLIPGGLLGLLPLHAAWIDDAAAFSGRRYVLDTVTIRYSPSLTTLNACQERSGRKAADGILAIDNPDGSLRFSSSEVNSVLAHFRPDLRCRLTGSAASHDMLLQNIASWPLLHFATHGRASWNEPLQGGLLLAGETTLTLESMMKLTLPAARLAVLSACETAIPEIDLLDEVISLPTGLLQAGVASVVASLWAVDDLSTALLIERFYEEWLSQGYTPAEALCRAQRWLRDVTRRELLEYDSTVTRGMRPPYPEQPRHQPKEVDPDERPYSHPYYWAAFTFTGA